MYGRRAVKKENALVRYFQETRVELKRVRWPTREEAWRLTRIVIIVTVSMTLFLWVMDVLFSWWLAKILEGNPWLIGLAFLILALAVGAGLLLSRRQE